MPITNGFVKTKKLILIQKRSVGEDLDIIFNTPPLPESQLIFWSKMKM